MKPALFITLSVLLTGLISPLHAEPVSGDFVFRDGLTIKQNYAEMEATAKRACKQAANRADTFVARISKDAREICTADLLDQAVLKFAIPELSSLHAAALRPQQAQFAKAD